MASTGEHTQACVIYLHNRYMKSVGCGLQIEPASPTIAAEDPNDLGQFPSAAALMDPAANKAEDAGPSNIEVCSLC